MTVYMYEDMHLCHDCYIKACDEASDLGRAEYFNPEQDPFYYPIQLIRTPEDAPTRCEGDYCDNELEWKD